MPETGECGVGAVAHKCSDLREKGRLWQWTDVSEECEREDGEAPLITGV